MILVFKRIAVRQNKKKRMAISGKMHNKVNSIIKPHIVPGTRYKLPCFRVSVSERKRKRKMFTQ